MVRGGVNRKKMEVRVAQGRPESICSVPYVIVSQRTGSYKSQLHLTTDMKKMSRLGPGRTLNDVWHARDEEERGITVQAPFQNLANDCSVSVKKPAIMGN